MVPNFSSSIPNPVSLKLLTGLNFDLNLLAQQVLENLESIYLLLKENNLQKIQATYMENFFRYNEEHDYIFKNEKLLPGVEKVKAKITGITAEGKLLLQTTDKLIACGFKEVEFVI